MTDSKTPEAQEQNSASHPSWLDKALIQQALRNGGEENSQVVEISVKPAVAPGDNYLSSIFRVKATLSDGKERSFIVKGPTAGGMTDMYDESSVFQREIAMLSDYIPKMEALLEEAAPGRFPPFGPRCYLHGTSPVVFIVMEDLAAPGFKMADRKRGLGLRHSLMGVQYLARFHAASYALLQRQPELKNISQIIDSQNKSLVVYMQGELQGTAIACRSWPGFEEIADRLEKAKDMVGTVLSEVLRPKPGDFNTIVHADFWTNNMMYRYQDGKPEELRVVDLQLAFWTSPTVDILLLFALSLSDDVLLHHQDLLLREYYAELKQTLELLGEQAPSLDSLLSATDERGIYLLCMSMETPLTRGDEAYDVSAVINGDYSGLLRLLEDPAIKRRMQHVLLECARKGWLPA